MQAVNIIKIGSDSIVCKNTNTLKLHILEKLIFDILDFEEKTGEKCLLLSSGAVAKGMTYLGSEFQGMSQASYASVGQHRLMKIYEQLLGGKKQVSQFLIDDKYNEKIFRKKAEKLGLDFSEEYKQILDIIREHDDEHMAETLIELIFKNLLVIVNHNDSTSPNELKNISDKSDNDKNTLHLSFLLNKYGKNKQIFVKRVIFLTNTNGLLGFDKKTITGGVLSIHNIAQEKEKYLQYIENISSLSGTGGMGSKVISAIDCLNNGVQTTIIANAQNGLECISDTKNCTTFTKK